MEPAMGSAIEPCEVPNALGRPWVNRITPNIKQKTAYEIGSARYVIHSGTGNASRCTDCAPAASPLFWIVWVSIFMTPFSSDRDATPPDRPTRGRRHSAVSTAVMNVRGKPQRFL